MSTSFPTVLSLLGRKKIKQFAMKLIPFDILTFSEGYYKSLTFNWSDFQLVQLHPLIVRQQRNKTGGKVSLMDCEKLLYKKSFFLQIVERMKLNLFSFHVCRLFAPTRNVAINVLPASFQYQLQAELTEKSIKIFWLCLHASASDSETERRAIRRQEIPSGIIQEHNPPTVVCLVDKHRKLFFLRIISLDAELKNAQDDEGNRSIVLI